MNRRDLHIKIIGNYRRTDQHIAMDRMIAELGSDAFSDEALRVWAMKLGRDRRLHNRFAAQSRAHYARQKAAEQ